ncbi:hypothetical protein ABC502_07705 [Alkalimonas sp. NCh-2]|uniref:hypothetical protein n=1 Tax=Alkalimonas sp. NCh-2 TaxID=3144846 RepID=UPI0031F66697
MSFSTVTTRTARKEHKCEFCGKPIAKGESYQSVFIANEGSAYSYKLHMFCDDICNTEAREADEYSTLDFLFDCARDRVTYVKDNADMADYYGVTEEQISFLFGEVAA